MREKKTKEDEETKEEKKCKKWENKQSCSVLPFIFLTEFWISFYADRDITRKKERKQEEESRKNMQKGKGHTKWGKEREAKHIASQRGADKKRNMKEEHRDLEPLPQVCSTLPSDSCTEDKTELNWAAISVTKRNTQTKEMKKWKRKRKRTKNKKQKNKCKARCKARKKSRSK